MRARKGYWAYSPEDAARAARPDRPSLPSGMASALGAAAAPATGDALRTWIGSDRADAGGQSTVTIVWELAPDTSRVEPLDDVGVTVSTKDGELIFRGRSPRDPAAVSPSGRLTFTTRPGSIRVRVSVEGSSGQFLDSQEREVQVPYFTAVCPIVTVSEIYHARTARELQQIRESGTALPTAIHQFSRTDQLLLRFRTCGPGGTTPEIAVRLRNSQGEMILNLPAPQRRPDGRFEVPFFAKRSRGWRLRHRARSFVRRRELARVLGIRDQGAVGPWSGAVQAHVAISGRRTIVFPTSEACGEHTLASPILPRPGGGWRGRFGRGA